MRRTRGTEFTKAMKKTHTILLPEMLGYHNDFLKAAFAHAGYHLEVMSEETRLADISLPYISGDYCLPAVLILGQMLATVKSGRWDNDKIAFMEPQTGGACRAGNYYFSMIESLEKAGYGGIPVISLNAFGEEKHEGFTITPGLIFAAAAAVCYGDLLMTLQQQIRPYEKEKGATDACCKYWTKKLVSDIASGRKLSRRSRKKRYLEIVDSFSRIETQEEKHIKVGVTGEIYIKFSKIGNEHLEDFLQKQGCEYHFSGFVNYLIYIVDSEKENQCISGANVAVLKAIDFLIYYLKKVQRDINEALLAKGFHADADFERLKQLAEPVIGKGCNVGDGWLIAAEAADMIEKGYRHILIVHPFGCLVSHVCERGILKKMRALYPDVSIQTIEYDYDSARTLRESRLLLGISE